MPTKPNIAPNKHGARRVLVSQPGSGRALKHRFDLGERDELGQEERPGEIPELTTDQKVGSSNLSERAR